MLMYEPISGFTSKGIRSGWHTIRIDIYCETAGSSDPLTGSLSGGAFEQSIDSLANGAKPCETALCSQSDMSSLLSENHIAVTVHLRSTDSFGVENHKDKTSNRPHF